ncbi:hypothetical protein AB0K48_26045, partial [Nonomuraea sp. NPDC055795]
DGLGTMGAGIAEVFAVIAVLHQGEVAESGRHDELVGRGGRYAALVHAQLGEAAAPGGPQDIGRSPGQGPSPREEVNERGDDTH